MADLMSFDDPRRPVWLASDLETLDDEEILEGYRDAREGFPCSGNRSRSYWHGWRNGMVDAGKMLPEVSMAFLVKDVIQKQRFDKLMTSLPHPTQDRGD